MRNYNRQKPVIKLAHTAAAKFTLSTLTAAAIAALVGMPALAAPTLEQQVDSLGKEVDKLKQKVEQQEPHAAGKTSVGGYGELHYNNLDSKKEIDFHRFVLFFGHQFSDRIRFASELELEHSNTENGGAVELEQAYVDFRLSDRHVARAGLFLVPIGILNETHEPPTFYGVERNPVETNVIPTTWWEGGAGLSGELAQGLSYTLALTSGLQVATSGADAYNIREGRKNVAKAPANNLAYTGRLKWTGIPGVELAASLQRQSDITQSAAGVPAVSALLAETHAVVSRGAFTVKALYAQWKLNGDGPKASGRDQQTGWYLEPSFRPVSKFGVFARYNVWDNQAGDSANSEKKQTNVGFNYWPHEDVVIKADIQRQSGVINDDGFNLGVGYMF